MFLTLKISDLQTHLKEMKRDGMEYVELSLFDSEEIDGDIMPPGLSLSGFKSDESDMRVDYEEVYGTNEFDSDSPIHTNL